MLIPSANEQDMRPSRNSILTLIARFNPFLYPKRVKTILSSRRLFFITGMGRSGSVFLSDLLNVPGADVYHETHADFKALVDAYWNPANANEYIDGMRGRVIASRILSTQCEIYGEVNGLLRFHVNALRRFENATILHLVRDGRLVVRSGMNRKAFTPTDSNVTGRIEPWADDPYRERWPAMDRFEKVCWYWASTVRYLIQLQVPVVRFEDVISTYEQFDRQLLQPLQVTVSYEHWQAEKSRPKNSNTENAFPVWRDWSADQKRQFLDICGDVMSTLGYEI